ncbi:HAMP domain-containing protein [Jeotgalibacillus malaysiensis]|uniref:HAMP domain-containing protein n=1 Tax=Jeotgalibacillus malaysiensis TaxID=1508404 RepID=UPI00384C5B34
MAKYTTLRKQFLYWTFAAAILIGIIGAVIHLFLMQQQIANQTENSADEIENELLSRFKQTEVAINLLEQELDTRMLTQVRLIASNLGTLNGSDVSREQLLQYKEEFQLDGLTIFQETGDDVTGTVTSEPEDEGFSLTEVGYYDDAISVLRNDEAYSLVSSETVTGTNISSDERHKYAYYRPEGADYFLSIYVESKEVAAFLNQAGPEALIHEITENLLIMEEAAVYQQSADGWDLIAGTEQTLSEDQQNLIGTDSRIGGERYYKLFFPVNESYAAYVSLDQSEITAPIYRTAFILMGLGLLPLILFIFLISRFFNRVADHIQLLINQVSSLEGGDLTVRNYLDDNGELRKLSVSLNKMSQRLNSLLKKATGYTTQAQRMSILLEKETKESARRLSELTVKSALMERHENEEVTQLLQDAEQFVKMYAPVKDVEAYLEKIHLMRSLYQQKSAAAAEVTISISDLLHSLHGQAEALAETSQDMMEIIDTFKIK